MSAWFAKRLIRTSNADHKDLEVAADAGRGVSSAIIEVKTSGAGFIGPAREAVGQQLWYRSQHGPEDATLVVVFDAKPPRKIVEFIEVAAKMSIGWWTPSGLRAPPGSRKRLTASGTLD